MSINEQNTVNAKEIYVNELILIDVFAETFTRLLKEMRPFLLNASDKISDSLLIIKEKLCVNKTQYNVLTFITELLKNNFNYILEIMDNFSNITLNLKEKIKEERIKCSKYNKLANEINEKYKTLLKTKKEFHSNAKNAEKETLDSNKSTEICDWEKAVKLKNLLKETKEKYNEYKNILNDINKIIINANESKNILVNSYNEIIKEYNDLFFNYLNIIIEKQKNKIKIDEAIQNQINNSKNIKFEYYNINLYEKPIEIIPFEQYHTILNFNDCEDVVTFNSYTSTIFTMEKYIDEYVSKEELNNEKYKNEIKCNLKQLLSLENDLFNEENQEKILNYINNQNTHQIFILLLTKLRVHGYEKSELFIKTIGECFNKILEEAEKKNDFDIAENCIIISQTFYYKDKNSGNKIYIVEFLKNKWIISLQYWSKRIDLFYIKDIEKIKNNDIEKWKNLDENLKNKKKGDILFSQIATSVHNMFELFNDKNLVLKVVDNILQKYNYLNEGQKNNIYNLIEAGDTYIDKKNETENNLNYREEKNNEIENERKETYNMNENAESNKCIEIHEDKENNEINENLEDKENNQNCNEIHGDKENNENNENNTNTDNNRNCIEIHENKENNNIENIENQENNYNDNEINEATEADENIIKNNNINDNNEIQNLTNPILKDEESNSNSNK